MGCGASSANEGTLKPAEIPADIKESKQLAELNAACESLADAIQLNATDGMLHDFYAVSPVSLGSGNFSTVRQCTDKRTGQKYAVKSINLKWASRDSMKRARRRSSGEYNGDTQEAGRRQSSGDLDNSIQHLMLLGANVHSSGTVEMKAKQLRRVYSNSSLELRQITREIDLLRTMKHDSIVDMREYFISSNASAVHIVLELLPGGDLVDALQDRAAFTEDEARLVAVRVLSGLEYLHARDCVHRDLKFENLLLKTEGDLSSVKIVDFGFARKFLGVGSLTPAASTGNSVFGASAVASAAAEVASADAVAGMEDPRSPISAAAKATFCGTPHYMAPEVIGLAEGTSLLRGGDGYHAAADMWAFGVVLSRMITGVVPFDADTQRELYALIKRGKPDMSGCEWDSVSTDAKELIASLLSTDVKLRPTATEALRHPWVTKRGSASASGEAGKPNPRAKQSFAAQMTAPGGHFAAAPAAGAAAESVVAPHSGGRASGKAALCAGLSSARTEGTPSRSRGHSRGPDRAMPAQPSQTSAARLEAALLRLAREKRLFALTTDDDDLSVDLIQQLLACGVLISDIPRRGVFDEMVARVLSGSVP